MARLGIDFGTTNTVVVCSDRGRYDVVPHFVQTAIGRVVRDIFPSLVAFDRETGALLYGPDAERCASRPDRERRYGILRSMKRLLRDYVGGGRIGFELRPDGFDAADLLRGFAQALRGSILRSGLLGDGEPLEAAITWPANANGAQRHVTRTCFRDAGFQVIGTLNEPSAAAIEFADRIARGNRAEARRLSATVAVFDLGGGTFDVSAVKISGRNFEVVASGGIEELGGDDLDLALARLLAHELGAALDDLTPLQRDLLVQHARQQKENICAGTVRHLAVLPADVGLRGEARTVPVAAFFDEIRPLLAPAADRLAELAREATAPRGGAGTEPLTAVYLVGGSSKLPLVSEMIAERLPGVPLVMTDKPFAATAMGAAIHSAEAVTLRDILSRHFGVLRLADHGTREYFAPIFRAGAPLPRHGEAPLECTVEYSPRHDVGHLRYFECAGVDGAGRPTVGVRAWSDVLFPYDPAIPVDRRLNSGDVHHRDDLAAHSVREVYSCDSDGVITVRLERDVDGQSRSYEIFRD